MIQIAVLSLPVLAAFAFTPALVSSANAAQTPAVARDRETKMYSWSGTARIVDDYSKKERSISSGGIVDATSVSQAREFAKDAMSAYAARFGSVVSVNIDTCW